MKKVPTALEYLMLNWFEKTWPSAFFYSASGRTEDLSDRCLIDSFAGIINTINAWITAMTGFSPASLEERNLAECICFVPRVNQNKPSVFQIIVWNLSKALSETVMAAFTERVNHSKQYGIKFSEDVNLFCIWYHCNTFNSSRLMSQNMTIRHRFYYALMASWVKSMTYCILA